MSLLEIQVAEIEEDVTGLGQGVNFLFDEQIIQDERLLNLETETGEIDEQLVLIDDDLESTFLEFLFSFFHFWNVQFSSQPLSMNHHDRFTGHNSGSGIPSNGSGGERRE